MNQSSVRRPKTRFQPLARLSIALALTGMAQAATIPDVPLHTMTTVEPNIMMTLDDSGSMQFEVIPESDVVYFTFPRADPLYGASWGYGDYYDTVARFNSTNRYARYFRTAKFNPLYYNPSKRYIPWSNADGSLMGDSAAGNACHNPNKCPDLTVGSVSEGTLNLTVDHEWNVPWRNDDGSEESAARTFYPATFFRFTGTGTLTGATDAANTEANFTLVEIKLGNAPFVHTDAAERTDCTLTGTTASCSYEKEIQNFANWYTYYRSRILTARAGIGRAFAAQGERLRVGFAAINKVSATIDGIDTRTVVRGVRLFSGTNRTDFFSDLYSHIMPSKGTPLRRALDDVGQYYSRTDVSGPWSTTPGSTGGTYPACRQSYTILMTDGYWTEGDEFAAQTADARANIDGTSGPTITGPNSQSHTYTATAPFSDARSDTLADVAMYYWKNDLNTGSDNKVPKSMRDPAFWQHMVTFGVGLGVSGTITQTDVGTIIDNKTDPGWTDPVGSNPGKLDDLLHAAANGRGGFFSAQDPTTFVDSLRKALDDIVNRISSAASVVANSTRLTTLSKVFSATFNTNNWTGELEAYGITSDGLSSTALWQASKKIPAASARKIFTTSGGSAVEFKWGNLSTTDQTAIGSADVADYLRGDQSKEVKKGGTFRDRASLLGDLVHSSPFYSSDNETVFIGANDGMLHAFNVDTGVEQFAYIPSPALAKLAQLSKTTYEHKFFVDGDIAVSSKSQTFLEQTYLTATLGRGGKGLFGLEVTTPSSFGSSNVLWEYVNGTGDGDLGYMLGKPVIAHLNNDTTAVIVGNGYNSTNGKAVLYVINLITGALIKKIDTGVGSDNGLAAPGVWDNDGDGFVDYVYAGDLKGNVWKFDLTDIDASKWDIANSSGKPFFVAKDSSNVLQPITAPITLARNYVNSDPNFGKVFLFFGTGGFFRSDDLADKNTQTWYGLVTTPSTSNEAISGRSALKERTITLETTADGKAARTFSTATTTPTNDMSGKLGWYIDLLATGSTKQGERIVTGSTLYRFTEPTLLASSIIPVANDPCSLGSGYLNAINAFTGASLSTNFFVFDQEMTAVVGSLDMGIGLLSQAAVLSGSSDTGKVVASGSGSDSGSGGGIAGGTIGEQTIKTGPPPKGRLSWREIIRN